MSEWEWQCISCGADMGPMVGKHAAKCPECGSRSAVCIPAPGPVRCRNCCCCHTVEGREWCVRHGIATSPGSFCAWGQRRAD